jgi:hypothetical protein
MNRQGRSIFLATLVMLAPAARTLAQESPTTLTKPEQTCQKRAGQGVLRYVRDVGHCLEQCHTLPGRQCDFFTDPQTTNCLDRVRAATLSAMLQNCGGFACPECYGGSFCDSFLSGQLSQALFSAEFALDAVFCDDSSSPDGLSAAERRCQKGLASIGGQFSTALGTCLLDCRPKVLAGQIPPAACDLANVDTPVFDPATESCVDRARSRFDHGCAVKCTDPPDCFPYTCDGSRSVIEAQFGGEATPLECFDSVCGDGQLTLGEVCDGSAQPTGCGPGLICSLDCSQCAPPQCGDGIVTPPEACDPFAIPTGCPGNLLCTDACTCEPPPSFCVPTSPDTCSSGFTDCFEPCDNFTPGSACVSTTEGTAVCVQEVCTFVSCSSSADCGPGEVCFTQGCCGTSATGAFVAPKTWSNGSGQ